MEELASELMEELTVETAFTIPVFGGIPVAESVVITWVIMAVLVILSICLTRNLKVENPSRRQVIVEYCVTWLQNLVKGFLGEEGGRPVLSFRRQCSASPAFCAEGCGGGSRPC